MSDQLQLEVGAARPVRVEAAAAAAGRTFMVSQFAEVARLQPEHARAFLADFEQAGVVEVCRGGWRLTDKGRAIAEGFRWWGTEEE